MKNTKNKKSCPKTSGSEEFNSNSCYYRFNERGFPKNCVCGGNVSLFTSQSKLNPGRPYFRCGASKADGHLFKWVEEGMYEEVVDMLQRESEIENEKIEVDEIKDMVLNLKEEIRWYKTELHKAKIKNMVYVVCLFSLVVLIIYYIMFQKGGNKLVFGL